MAASKLHDPPPVSQIGFDSIFRYARSLKKVGFFAETRLGVGPKMKEFLKKIDSTWSGKFFDGRSTFFKTEFWAFWGNMTKFGPKTPQNRQKWTKMDKVGQKHDFRMMKYRHVHKQSYTPSTGMRTPCQGIL